jgi:DNA-directed RNA polymerase specialized sigma24 family protein
VASREASFSPSSLEGPQRSVNDAALARSEWAWHQLFDYYYPRVFRLIASRLGPDEAESAAHDAFVDAYMRATRSGDHHGPTVGALILLEARRRLLDGVAPSDGVSSHTLGFVRDEYLSPDLRAVLEPLPPEDRIALELRHVVGLASSEAAVVMGLTLEAFRSLMLRALRLAREADWVE